jgi:FkbM family methyltransferase
MRQPIVYYSQNKEDLILASVFKDKKKGFYVDVGANHPTYDSVTKYFYEKGWNGINIDPIRNFYNLLQLDRPRDININSGVSNENGKLSLREYSSEAGEGMSTFSEDLKKIYSTKKHWATTDFTDYQVKTQKLSEIFNKCQATSIDFMKIDVEGFEYEVLASNNWKKYRPKIICIESNHIVKDWRPILKQNYYELFFKDGLNNYYFDKQLSPSFEYSYSEDFLMRFPETISYREYSKSTHLSNQLEFTYKLLELEGSSDSYPQHTLNSLGPKTQLRALIKALDSKFIQISTINNKVKVVKSKNPKTEAKKILQNAYIHDNSIGTLKISLSSIYIRLRPLLIKFKALII